MRHPIGSAAFFARLGVVVFKRAGSFIVSESRAGRSAFGAYYDHAWFGHGVCSLFVTSYFVVLCPKLLSAFQAGNTDFLCPKVSCDKSEWSSDRSS